MKRFVLILAAVAAIFAVSCVSTPAEPAAAPAAAPVAAAPAKPVASTPAPEVQLVILHTNDMHGHPLAFDNSPMLAIGGLPAIATFVGQTKAEYDNVLILDAGDINTGRPESNFFKAEPDIIGYNMIGYDAVVMGNHEFDNELSVFEQQKAWAEFPFISANATRNDGVQLADAPYIIREYQGVRVGIFGITSTETRIIGSPGVMTQVTVADEVPVATAMVKKLREEELCHVVIAVVHMGLYSTNESGSRMLAAKVPGIDLIIDGHTHSYITAPVVENGIPIVQAGQWGMYVGKGIMTIKNGKPAGFTWEPVSINHNKQSKTPEGVAFKEPVGPQFAEHYVVKTELSEYAYKVEGLLKVQVGEATEIFPNAMSRKAETAIGDLVADAMKYFTLAQGVDFAINNGGGIRADLPAGPITKKTVYTILPFDNSITVLKLKGTDVQLLFDFIATIAQGKGAFPQVSDGVTFTIDYEQGKCTDIMIGGAPLDPAKVYTIATNSYMAIGGDGYVAFKANINTYETSVFQRDALIEYLKFLGKPIAPEIKGRITIKGSKTS